MSARRARAMAVGAVREGELIVDIHIKKYEFMEVKTLKSWEEFLDEIQKMREHKEKNDDFWFRGQSDESWSLESTLERRVNECYLEDYLVRVRRSATRIESVTGRNWVLPVYDELVKKIEEIDLDDHHWVKLPMLDYLVYLRHYGYPSPLLDWTESPFIAAYFAYIGLTQEEKSPAVFVFLKRDKRSQLGHEPIISMQDRYLTTDKRHVLQKTRFTIATRYDDSCKKMFFCQHGSRLDAIAELTKIILPAKDRKKALKYLEDHNINHFSLFGSEDSLITTMAVNDFDLKL